MKKSIKYISALALVLTIMPMAAQAHGNKNSEDKDRLKANISAWFQKGERGDDRFRSRDIDSILDEKANLQYKSGKVTAVSSASFTLTAEDGTVYTVNTSGATFNTAFNGSFLQANLKAEDYVRVKGSVSGNAITAKTILVSPANTQPAKGKGTVTAVSGSTLTVQTKGNNTVTVNTDANTSVTKTDGSTGVVSDVAVGSKVSVKGLWNCEPRPAIGIIIFMR
jgi:hypothetical protein